MKKKNISVIIPACNEEEIITETIQTVKRQAYQKERLQIIVVDGLSSDETIRHARKTEAEVVKAAARGRANQMNRGAERGVHEILYFLHADTRPPKNFDKFIIESIENGYDAGCFRLSFDRSHLLLQFYSWFTRFDINAFRFGDQSLFILQNTFEEIGGFDSSLFRMEDQEIIGRIKQKYSFIILPQKVITSARRYQENGMIRLQLIFTLIFILYYAGVPQKRLRIIYDKLMR